MELVAELEATKELVAGAQRAVKEAEDRAMAAEMAKIQLSMQLAETDDRQALGRESESPGQDGEESFAQSVTARRAATAEREVEDLKQQLQNARSTIDQLEFQVSPLP